MPVKLSKWCRVNVFVLTVCNPSAPADGDSLVDKSFKEKSIPNLFIDEEMS